MAFTPIKPVAVSLPHAIMARTIKADRKGSAWKLQISVPNTCMGKAKWFNAPERLMVLIGDGPDEGKLLIREEQGEEKGIKVGHLKHTCMFRLPVQDWMPQMDIEPHEVKAVYSDKQIILALPEWAWNKDRQRAIDVARRQKRADAAKRLAHQVGA